MVAWYSANLDKEKQYCDHQFNRRKRLALFHVSRISEMFNHLVSIVKLADIWGKMNLILLHPNCAECHFKALLKVLTCSKMSFITMQNLILLNQLFLSTEMSFASHMYSAMSILPSNKLVFFKEKPTEKFTQRSHDSHLTWNDNAGPLY